MATSGIFLYLQNFLGGHIGNTYNAAKQGVPGDCIGGNGVECGVDIDVPWGTPIASPVTGKIVGIYQDNKANSIGYVVQIQDINGNDFHVQHLMGVPKYLPTQNFQVGAPVSVGDVIGYSGGCPFNGYGSNPNRCTSTDQWSTGPHIEIRYGKGYSSSYGEWGQAWEDPRPLLTKLANAYKGNSSLWNRTSDDASGPNNIPQGKPGTYNPSGDAAAQCNPTDNMSFSDQISFYQCYFGNMITKYAVLWGEEAGIFLLALIFIVLGFYLMVK